MQKKCKRKISKTRMCSGLQKVFFKNAENANFGTTYLLSLCSFIRPRVLPLTNTPFVAFIKEKEMTATSISERAAAPAIKALGGIPCDTFAPHLPTTYRDAEDAMLEGKPDYLFRRAGSLRFMEWKAGKLNRHFTFSSSHEALQQEYRGPRRSHSFLSEHFWHNGYGSGKQICRDHAFNYALYKVLALQAEHGWRKYIMCFERNPKPDDAKRYAESGLVWCTMKTLEQLLLRIELNEAGLSVSFVHRTTQYEYEVIFDNGTATPDEIRTNFLAAVAADHEAIAAQEAQREADEAAGLLPF
jgi:hypothetical protein